MDEALDERNIATEFVEKANDVVHIGYRSHQTDAVNLFTELQLVASTVLEQEPETEIKGALFHTEYPVIGLWQVDATWADKRQSGDLSETELGVKILHTLRTARFH